MKNIIKTLIVMLTSVSLFASANAGELTVNGTAKATYNSQSGNTNGQGIGITNELNFTASGELDNGFTWAYSMELDPTTTGDTAATPTGTPDGAALNDDTKLTLTTPYGTVGAFVSEGGLDVEDAASQSVYARPTDAGDPTSGAGDNYTIDSYSNLQYHTPAGLLPLSTTVKVAMAPSLSSNQGRSGNAAGEGLATESVTRTGSSAQEVQIKMAPVDGLSIGASFFEFNNQGNSSTDQKAESGAYYATYATGPFSVGYSQAYKSMIYDGITSATQVDYYDQQNISIAYAVNDALSISYEKEEDEKNFVKKSVTSITQESEAYQLAYTMGGMTIAASHSKYTDVGYTVGKDIDQNLLAVTMAF